MEKKKNRALKVSFLVIVMLIVMAFTKGQVQEWLMMAAVSVWLLFAFGIKLLRFIVKCIRRAKKRVKNWMMEFKEKVFYEETELEPKKIYNFDLSQEPEHLTMLYVNHLITVHLQSAYPKATWDWISKNPFALVKGCGTGKICTRNTGEYDLAEVSFDKIGGISVDLFQYAPKKCNNPEQTNEFDLSAWYCLKGQQALSQIVKELKAKGYASLILKNGGEVFTGNEEKQTKNEAMILQDFPEKAYWKKLTDLMSKDHFKAVVQTDCILVEW